LKKELFPLLTIVLNVQGSDTTGDAMKNCCGEQNSVTIHYPLSGIHYFCRLWRRRSL
jgi:hypothetical protein